jgi:hypothetical protein
MGRAYSATFSAVAITAAQDTFEINAAAAAPVRILGCHIGQYSDFGDAQDELLSILFITGYTTSGSGGSAFTALPVNPGDAAFGGTVEINNTTVANTGTAAIRHADAFNVRAGYVWMPIPEARILIAAGARGVLRITAPADSITTNGTIYFEELS